MLPIAKRVLQNSEIGAIFVDDGSQECYVRK